MGEENNYDTTNGNGILGQNDQLQQQEQYFDSTHAPPQSASAPLYDQQHPSDDQRINVPDACCAYTTPSVANPVALNHVKLETIVPSIVLDHDEHPQEPSSVQLPCCGIGIGWSLFMLGFIFPFVWIGGGLLLCTKYNRQEKPGYIACSVLVGILVSFPLILLLTQRSFSCSFYWV
ncbi:60S ribosomal protein L18a-like protein [Linum grandiflorum]